MQAVKLSGLQRNCAEAGQGSYRRATGLRMDGPAVYLQPPGRRHRGQVMQLAVYVNFRGSCEEAFRFYREHLGAELEGEIRRHGEVPNPNIPADWADKVLHARMRLGSTILMGADVPAAEPMRSSYLTIFADAEAEAERVYRELAGGGEVFMELQQTPFANRFAMLRDRFGANWMLLHQP